ncbi:50S ribosomal protein L3 [Candidatus Parcubacteria bacterium]|nr:50S ribosomal protein L3 [Candidatus Parcubacteria bacterium]
MKFILAKKLNMSQIFDEKGKVIPVTILETGPVKIIQIKTKEKDGYAAIQIGFSKKKNISKPLKGHLKNIDNFRWLKEFRVNEDKNIEGYKVGDEIKVDVLNEGETVNIRGLSRGKGFQGVVKRHGFHGKDATHGVKHAHRQPGSIGATTPQHVIKGKKMAGRTGGENITVKKVKVIKVEPQKNLLYLKGAIPGKRGTLIEISS